MYVSSEGSLGDFKIVALEFCISVRVTTAQRDCKIRKNIIFCTWFVSMSPHRHQFKSDARSLAITSCKLASNKENAVHELIF